MKVNVIETIVLMLVAIAVFLGVQAWIVSADMTLFPYGYAIQAIFSTGTMTVAVTLLVNISGYIENAVSSNTEVQYEAKKLGETFARYTGYMTVFSGTIISLTQGTQYLKYASIIAAGVSLAADLIRRTFAQLATPAPHP